MICKYCVDCENFEKRPIMCEIPSNSGNMVQTGWYHKCKVSGRIFNTWNMSKKTIGLLPCSCDGFLEKKISAETSNKHKEELCTHTTTASSIVYKPVR